MSSFVRLHSIEIALRAQGNVLGSQWGPPREHTAGRRWRKKEATLLGKDERDGCSGGVATLRAGGPLSTRLSPVIVASRRRSGWRSWDEGPRGTRRMAQRGDNRASVEPASGNRERCAQQNARCTGKEEAAQRVVDKDRDHLTPSWEGSTGSTIPGRAGWPHEILKRHIWSVQLERSQALYVSSMSHSSPSTQRRADSFPLIMPHSKSSHGPRCSTPISPSVFFAARTARSHTVSTTTQGDAH